MSGGAEILGVGMLCPEGPPAAVAMPAWWGDGPCFAYQFSGQPGAGIIPPGSMRRLGRTQRMALAAAHLAVKDSPVALRAGDDAAVAVGTGLGELGETAAFLENMIALDEREPKPASFVNSVHNSLASQIAMALGLKGENHLFTHGAASFELALGQALLMLDAGRAEQVLVCGADGLSPYFVAAGRDFGWWRSGAAAIAPLGAAGENLGPGLPARSIPTAESTLPSAGTPQVPGGEELESALVPRADSSCRPGPRFSPAAPSKDAAGAARTGTLPGEGAAALLLARPGSAGRADGRTARIAAVLARPGATASFDAAGEVSFIAQVLDRAQLAPGDLGLVLCGANGDERLDGRYRQVEQALISRVGRAVPWGGYKQLCGEFCTAPALATVMAARMVREEKGSGVFCRNGPSGGCAQKTPAPFSSVLVYHLAASGQHSACVVSR